MTGAFYFCHVGPLGSLCAPFLSVLGSPVTRGTLLLRYPQLETLLVCADPSRGFPSFDSLSRILPDYPFCGHRWQGFRILRRAIVFCGPCIAALCSGFAPGSVGLKNLELSPPWSFLAFTLAAFWGHLLSIPRAPFGRRGSSAAGSFAALVKSRQGWLFCGPRLVYY